MNETPTTQTKSLISFLNVAQYKVGFTRAAFRRVLRLERPQRHGLTFVLKSTRPVPPIPDKLFAS